MAWQDQLIKYRGDNASTGGNVRLILENDLHLAGRFRHNSFTLRTEVRFTRPIEITAACTTWRPIEDSDVVTITDYINAVYRTKVDDGFVGKRIAAASAACSFDPLINYLNSVKWDGTNRLDNWTATYLGVPDTKYSRLVGRKYLIGAAARGLTPGTKLDYVLILEGKQGTQKSTALRTLFGAEFFSDTSIDIGSKDSRIALQGVWLIEFAELDAFTQKDANRLKSFLSQLEDKYRPPYGRNDIVVPRRCAFAGTTNSPIYLKDETGNRRFWPMETSVIDIEALERDRDQLWAEAVEAHRRGEKHWLKGEAETALAAIEAAARVEEDPWITAVRLWLAPREHAPVTREELLVGALGKSFDAWDPRANARLGASLKRLDWTRVRRRVDGDQRWFYQKDANAVLSREAYDLAEVRRNAAIVLAKKGPHDAQEESHKVHAVPPKPAVVATA